MIEVVVTCHECGNAFILIAPRLEAIENPTCPSCLRDDEPDDEHPEYPKTERTEP